MSILDQYEIRYELTASLLWANIYALIFFVPVIVIPALAFHWLWPEIPLLRGISIISEHLLWTIVIMAALVVTHELMHGITSILLGGLQWNDIVYKIKWKKLAVLTHITKPISVRAWRWSAAMPLLVQGIVPLILGLALGSPVMLFTGMLMTASAGGDLISLWLLRKDDPHALVIDHPEKVGCCIIADENKID